MHLLIDDVFVVAEGRFQLEAQLIVPCRPIVLRLTVLEVVLGGLGRLEVFGRVMIEEGYAIAGRGRALGPHHRVRGTLEGG